LNLTPTADSLKSTSQARRLRQLIGKEEAAIKLLQATLKFVPQNGRSLFQIELQDWIIVTTALQRFALCLH